MLALILALTFAATRRGDRRRQPGHRRRRARGRTPSAIARGAYLVRLSGCNDCHTPWKMGPKGPEPDMTRALTGHPSDSRCRRRRRCSRPVGLAGAATNTALAGPWGVSFTANLTPDKETGLGNWTEEMFIATMRTGRHEGKGRPILPPMPYQIVGALTDDDMKAVFAYLQSLPPVQQQGAGADRSAGGADSSERPPCDVAAGALALALGLAATLRRRRHRWRRRPLPERLSETGLYLPGTLTVDPRNRPFSPQYPLWTDGAAQARWIQLPAGATIDARDADTGSSRSARASGRSSRSTAARSRRGCCGAPAPTRWSFATYVWNEAQTDAMLAPAEGLADVAEVAPGKRHSIPSRDDCRACHDNGAHRASSGSPRCSSRPIATRRRRTPSRCSPGWSRCRRCVDERLLDTGAAGAGRAPPRIPGDARTRAVLGYCRPTAAAATTPTAPSPPCASRCGCRPTRRRRRSTQTIGAARRPHDQVGAAAQRAGHHATVKPGAPDLSALLVRMRSRRPSSQMPPLGTTLADRDAIDLVSAGSTSSVDVTSRSATTPESLRARRSPRAASPSPRTAARTRRG